MIPIDAGDYRVPEKRNAVPVPSRLSTFAAAPILLSALCAAFVSGCATTPSADKAKLTPEEIQLNIESFEQAWSAVRDKNWDPDLGGLDWQAVHDELRPQIEKANTMKEARRVLRDMTQRLEQSHFAIIPASVYEEFEDSPEDENGGRYDGWVGIDVRVLLGRATVTSVEPDSPASTKGVRPGWEIIRIDGKKLAPLIARIEDTLSESTIKDFMLVNVLNDRLTGTVGEAVTVRFLDGGGKRVTLELERVKQKGFKVSFGNLPVGYVWIDTRLINDTVGYIAFNFFMDPIHVMPAFEDAVKAFMDEDGIIIDLRGNGGGIGAMAMGMAGWFVKDKEQYLGTMRFRDAELRFALNPRLETYTGPLAILVDGCSASCAEIFAGGLRDLGRARLFGEVTAGAALPATFERFPNGDGFMYPIADYVSKDGDRFEGVGITPDVESPLTRGALLDGRDPALDAAVQWIREEKESK